MDNQEQQLDELNALQAIYPLEFKLLNGDVDTKENNNNDNNKCHKFSISVSSDISEKYEDASNACDDYELELLFRLPNDYPMNVGPEIEVINSKNLGDHDETEILNILNEMIPENLGMVMCFTLVSRAFEWINSLKEKKIIERRNEEQRKKLELEELERKKFEGTRVTVESFIAWKNKFDAEMAELRKKQQHKNSVKDNLTGKLTGKEMFLRDKNLIDSDLNFPDADLGDTDDTVKVDESLFQDVDDIDEDELIE